MSFSAKLDHCVIHVSNWERSNWFYRKILGAELIDDGRRVAYRFGDTQLNIHGPGIKAGPLAKIPVPPGGSDLCFEWPGPIQGAVEHLNRSDIPIELGPIQRFGAKGKGSSVYFRDPDGSLLELISYATVE